MDFATRLVLSTNVVLINKIPKSHLKHLPASLAVFHYSDRPQIFLTNGLQALLDQSAFAGTNISELLHGTNGNLFESGGIYLKNEKRPPDIFSVNPLRGDILLENVERQMKIPQKDTVPSCKEIQARLLKLTQLLGIKTNEIEMSNGVVKITCGDAQTSAWSGHGMGRVHFVNERWATIPRGLNGYSSWLLDDKIVLDYGVDNQLMKFSVHWPDIEPIKTNRLLTVSEMVEKIKASQTLADKTDIKNDDLSRITLKDIEIQYYCRQSRSFRGMMPVKADIFPIAAILTTFKSKSGQTEDAGIYFPILESP